MKNVAREDMWTMLLSTVRYSMGSRKYMMSTSIALVRTYAEYLTVNQLQQIVKEIGIERSVAESVGRTLGAEFDHST